MSEDVEFIVCLNCDTPCYSFDHEEKAGVAVIKSAFCNVCGNDEPKEFRLPTDDEIEE